MTHRTRGSGDGTDGDGTDGDRTDGEGGRGGAGRGQMDCNITHVCFSVGRRNFEPCAATRDDDDAGMEERRAQGGRRGAGFMFSSSEK